MTVTIPTAFTEYDWLELIAFDSKVNREGYGCAADNYAPRFETPEMQAVAADGRQLKFLYDRQQPAIDAWWDTEPNGVDLVNAHIDEERKRRENGRLWGIRCTDGHVITCDTRDYRDQLAASMQAEEARPGRRVPAARLQRFFAGAGWHETRLTA
jgi:hypothetical protein